MDPGKRGVLTAGVLAAALLSACGATQSPPYGSGPATPLALLPSSTSNPSVNGAQSTTQASPPRLELVAVNNRALGWVVQDGHGWILYRFDKDRATPKPKPSCLGACAKKWPPVLVNGNPVVRGISRSIVGRTQRPDGTWQLTLHGWPVYRYAGDRVPGQWLGQGLGHTWFTIKRTGARNTVPARAPSGSTALPTNSGGYGNYTSD
jgi:predicted lipoprotein with Yx(FWY)xxD motif